MIDWRNKDIYGKDIPEKNRAQWYRLRKWQRKSRISGPGERNLALALNEMNRESSRLKLPKIIHESASVIYREAMEKDLIRGRSIEWVVAASLFVACRRGKVLRTLDEIADVSGIGKKEVGKTYRFIARELGIKVPFFTPMEYIPKYGSKLNLSGEVQAKAIAIIEEARKNGLISGSNPTGVAAAALYLASRLLGEHRTQYDIANIAEVSEATIRKRYNELNKILNIQMAT